VAGAEINPLLHFVTTGENEGRWPAGSKPDENDRFPRAAAWAAQDDAAPEAAIVFLIDLVQDVSMLRPLVLMAAEFDLPIMILVSGRFAFLDHEGTWQAEIAALAGDTGARVLIFGSAKEAADVLPERGLIFAASESSAPAHALSHAVFVQAPEHLYKVTLQHGFECLGFRHNREHDRTNGETIHFAADSVCAWYSRPALTAFDHGAGTDLCITGPTSLLYHPPAEVRQLENEADALAPGLIGENLHSVRYLADEGLVEEFVRGISQLAASESRRAISVRPHPAGAFIAHHRDRLPNNVLIAAGPLWKIGLERHAYAICSASSLVIDAMLAGVPTAIWQDRGGLVDTSAFDGLPKVSDPHEWIAFAQQARLHPGEFISAQRRWLDALGFVTDPATVRSRFEKLFGAFVAQPKVH